MVFDLMNSPMVRKNPSLAEPWPKRSPQERELVNQRLVESYSSSPLYQQAAKESGDEAEYWRNFSVMMGVHTLRHSSPPAPAPDTSASSAPSASNTGGQQND